MKVNESSSIWLEYGCIRMTLSELKYFASCIMWNHRNTGKEKKMVFYTIILVT